MPRKGQDRTVPAYLKPAGAGWAGGEGMVREARKSKVSMSYSFYFGSGQRGALAQRE